MFLLYNAQDMKRATARRIHEATNITYWLENPDWQPGTPGMDFLGRVFAALPFSVHELQKRALFDTDRLLAVNGESVVATSGEHEVDKFMFRYPGDMPLTYFEAEVTRQVMAVTSCLAGVALSTSVRIKAADIFRWPGMRVPAVTQTQRRLDLDVHKALNVSTLEAEGSSRQLDTTARDLEVMLLGVKELADMYGYYPDVSQPGDNVRRSVIDGSVTLIDVMPVYDNGNRLIGDNPPGLLEGALAGIERYQAFVGQYGG